MVAKYSNLEFRWRQPVGTIVHQFVWAISLFLPLTRTKNIFLLAGGKKEKKFSTFHVVGVTRKWPVLAQEFKMPISVLTMCLMLWRKFVKKIRILCGLCLNDASLTSFVLFFDFCFLPKILFLINGCILKKILQKGGSNVKQKAFVHSKNKIQLGKSLTLWIFV